MDVDTWHCSDCEITFLVFEAVLDSHLLYLRILLYLSSQPAAHKVCAGRQTDKHTGILFGKRCTTTFLSCNVNRLRLNFDTKSRLRIAYITPFPFLFSKRKRKTLKRKYRISRSFLKILNLFSSSTGKCRFQP